MPERIIRQILAPSEVEKRDVPKRVETREVLIAELTAGGSRDNISCIVLHVK